MKGETKVERKKAVLVTTQFRGVFFGFVKDESSSAPEKITLTQARNCLYWSTDVRGFLGLAAVGPSENCRVGATVDELTLFGVTSISRVSPEAVESWQLA